MGLKYYAYMNYALVSDLLIKYSIKTDNQLMGSYDSSWQDFPDTGRITWYCIIFYQCGTIDHATHVPGWVSHPIAESEYNAACTAGMDLANFRMLIHEFFEQGYRHSSRVRYSDCIG